VIDTDPSVSFTGQLTDVSQVEKFDISDAEYAKRQGTSLHLVKESYLPSFDKILYWHTSNAIELVGSRKNRSLRKPQWTRISQ